MSIYIYKVDIDIYIRAENPYDKDSWHQFTVNVEAVAPMAAENLALLYIRHSMGELLGYKRAKSYFRTTDIAFPQVQEINAELYKVERIT
jgi:hypothetical protein